MFYLYVLYSQQFSKSYTGTATDVVNRLKVHNDGKVKSTRPWLASMDYYIYRRVSHVVRGKKARMVFKIYSARRERKKKNFGKGRDPGPKGLGTEFVSQLEVEPVRQKWTEPKK